jgi:hypothetical protein
MNILNRSALGTNKGLPFFETSEIARFKWVRHGFLTRKGGVSPPPYEALNVGTTNGYLSDDITKNRDLIATTFGFDRNRLVLLRQVHQDRILVLKAPPQTLLSHPEYDAMVTNLPDLVLGIRTADCLPILIVDRSKKVIAAIHAGRSGTALRITAKTLTTMRDQFGCSLENLRVAMGPSIGPCCYQIDEKVFQPEWDPFSVPCGEGRWRVDLARINLHQMEKAGIARDQIDWIDLCTRCNSDLFFSYRKEGSGRTGTQLSFIGMTDGG